MCVDVVREFLLIDRNVVSIAATVLDGQAVLNFDVRHEKELAVGTVEIGRKSNRLVVLSTDPHFSCFPSSFSDGLLLHLFYIWFRFPSAISHLPWPPDGSWQ